MADTLYDRVGGEPFFVDLVSGFYAGVADDPILSSLYPLEDLEGAERRLRLFLIQYFGGPNTYDAERGHPRLRLRHVPFAIDERAKDAWLSLMLVSLDATVTRRRSGEGSSVVSTADEQALRTYLVDTANFLINRGGLSFSG